MPLYDRAILEIDGIGEYSDRTGVFVIREDMDDIEEVDPQFIVGNRGQYISELYDHLTDVTNLPELPGDRERRAGFHLDGGAGDDLWTISGATSTEDPDEQWGDGSTSPTNPDDVSRYDATGCHPVAKRDILGAWIAQNRHDSGGQTRLYRGEWSDGTYADEAGVFGRPVPVAVRSARLERAHEDPSKADVTLELTRTTTVPDIEEAADELIDEIGDLIPDY